MREILYIGDVSQRRHLDRAAHPACGLGDSTSHLLKVLASLTGMEELLKAQKRERKSSGSEHGSTLLAVHAAS